MEDLFKLVASYIALGIEAGAVLLILIGASNAFYQVTYRFFTGKFVPGKRADKSGPGLGFGCFSGWNLNLRPTSFALRFLRTGLKFGQLAAIAAIRTGLNYFLEKDIEKSDEAGVDVGASKPSIRAA